MLYKNLTNNSIILMLLSIILWMLYPPVVNHLLNQLGVFYIAAVSHTFAAITTLICLTSLFFGRKKINFKSIFNKNSFKKTWKPTLIAGTLVCANHLLLYAALSVSTEFDIIAILIFETWPILFFYIDNKFRRKNQKTKISDYIFSGAAFAGFLIIMVPNIIKAEFSLIDSPVINTILLASLGGFAMAMTCYFRMKCMDYWSDISKNENLNLNGFKLGLLTEAGVRLVAAPILICILLIFGQDIPSTNITNLLLLAFIGVAILAFGSLLYDLSIFNSENSSVGSLWYLMPVGAAIILAIMENRMLNKYEAISSALIVSSNIFLSLDYKIKKNILVFFVSVCVIFIFILFYPLSIIDSYYDLIALEIIIFILLKTILLDK
jgi:drug/metabolite transporter (DMT)-like permease